jgi:hypothetical protein
MCLHYEKTNEFPRILVCASSNDAIDEIANCLVISDEAKQSQYNSNYQKKKYQKLL